MIYQPLKNRNSLYDISGMQEDNKQKIEHQNSNFETEKQAGCRVGRYAIDP